MAPENALKQMPDGGFDEVGISEVDTGDILLVRTGAKIPVDGTVLSGKAVSMKPPLPESPFPY